MSLLDAVNLCLSGASLDSVSNLDQVDTDAQNAQMLVEHQSALLQSQSWYFNTEPNWKLKPDLNGHITVPTGCNSIVTSGEQRYVRNLTIRGTKIYDMNNHTYDLTDHLTGDGYLVVTLIMQLEWDLLPLQARMAIAYWSRITFSQDSEVDLEKAKVQSPEVKRAMDYLEKENRRFFKTNLYYDNPEIATKLSLIGGVNSRGYMVSSFPRRNTY